MAVPGIPTSMFRCHAPVKGSCGPKSEDCHEPEAAPVQNCKLPAPTLATAFGALVLGFLEVDFFTLEPYLSACNVGAVFWTSVCQLERIAPVPVLQLARFPLLLIQVPLP